MSADILTFAQSPAIERCQPLAPEEAAMLAEAEVKRLAHVRRKAARIFGLRSEINRLDACLQEAADHRARLLARVSDPGRDGWAPPLPALFFWATILVMLALEVPVNAAALDLLRLPALESVMLALFLALANLLAAKYSGRVLRQWDGLRDGPRDLALAGTVNLVLLLALAMMAQLRAQASDNKDTTIAFLALQLLFYAVALLASYLHTNPSAEAEQDQRLLARSTRALSRAWKRRACMARRYNIALEQTNAEVRTVEQDCARRIFERRSRLSRGPVAPPAFFREPITAANFQPLDLGQPVDLHPDPLGVSVANDTLSAAS